MPTYSDVFSGRSQYSLIFVVTQGTQDVANNRTLMSWSLRIDETTEWGSWSNSSASWASNVNGPRGSGSFTYNFGSVNSIALGSGSVWVTHTANGTKSISVSASVGGNTTIGNASISASLAITTIPRASTSSWAVQGETKLIGNTYTINTNRASTGFTHTLQYFWGNMSGTIATGVGASYAWAIPTTFLTQIPNGIYGTGTLRTLTYSGGTLIGTKDSTMGLTAKPDVVPSFDTITVAEGVPIVASTVGLFVQALSKLTLAITGAAGVSGSTIKSYKIEVDGQAINASSGTTPNPISLSGTVPVKGTVTDSRGRTATKTVNVSVLPYKPPAFAGLGTGGVSVQRSLAGGTVNEQGTYLRVNINATVSSLINSTQRNSLRYRVSTRVKTALNNGTYTIKVDTTTAGIAFNSYVNIGTYSITEAYDVLVEIIDKFATSTILIAVPTAKIFMHWDASNGVGIGKYRENGALDVAGDIYSKGVKDVSPQQMLYFKTPGNFTFTKATYPWLHAIRVRLVGGGGAGGGSAAGGSGHSQGGGGGGGGYAEKFLLASVLEPTESITVGAGGLGVTGAIGNPGGDSTFGMTTFGAKCSAGGGSAGNVGAASALYVSGNGGPGGTGGVGDLVSEGDAGSPGTGLNTLGVGGPGGSSLLGGGAPGVYTGAGSGSNTGYPGRNYGGGGGGAATNSGGAAAAGGAGAGGVVIIELFA